MAFYEDPTYRLARYLVDWFRTTCQFQYTQGIKNSTVLAQKLQHLKLPATSILVSFDAESMYTRIPVQQAIAVMITHLQRVLLPADVIEDFKTLLSHCIDKNVCVFQKTIYQFPDGLPPWEDLSRHWWLKST